MPNRIPVYDVSVFSNLNYFESLSVVSSLEAKCVVKKLGMFFV